MMESRINMIRRWQRIIRHKAEYDHEARKKGKIVTEPDLDSVANEMEAFIAGYEDIEITGTQMKINPFYAGNQCDEYPV